MLLLADGSYLSRLRPPSNDNKDQGMQGVVARVVKQFINGNPQAQPLYRLVTRLLDAGVAAPKSLRGPITNAGRVSTRSKR